MASNQFGNVFRITTWGESHGKAIGVVIDGCPAGLSLTENDINSALSARAPGNNPFTSPRKEPDIAEILSGVFEQQTTGAPISILIKNHRADPSKYDPIKTLLRPGHANFTYLEKYGCFDYRGGGRASARETACRVAAGAVARKLLTHANITTLAYLDTIGEVSVKLADLDLHALSHYVNSSPLFCPCPQTTERMIALLNDCMQAGDSIGGCVTAITTGLPAGLGDPVYEKLEANLAKAMLSLPASKGFEIGEGFGAAQFRGEQHNDRFTEHKQLASNHAGGTLGGISTGANLTCRVAFKPAASIKKPQTTCDLSGKPVQLQLPPGAMHDPCVAIRAVPVVEAMINIVLADAWLMNRCARLSS